MRTRHGGLGLVVLGALTLLGLWLLRGGVQSRSDAPSPARAAHPQGSASLHRPSPQRTGEGPRLRGGDEPLCLAPLLAVIADVGDVLLAVLQQRVKAVFLAGAVAGAAVGRLVFDERRSVPAGDSPVATPHQRNQPSR